MNRMITAFRELIEPLRIFIFNYKWIKRNKHNRTFAGNRFDINKVVVGIETYGKINVFSYNDINCGILKIGNYCCIARSVNFLLSGNHDYKKFSMYPFSKIFFNTNYDGSKGDIIIEDDVWIGENVTVLSGSKIGQGALVAAGAVICGDVPPYAIVGGVPAKILKYRFSDDIIELLKNIKFNELSKKSIFQNRDLLEKEISCKDDLKWLMK